MDYEYFVFYDDDEAIEKFRNIILEYMKDNRVYIKVNGNKSDLLTLEKAINSFREILTDNLVVDVLKDYKRLSVIWIEIYKRLFSDSYLWIVSHFPES